jgi:hypothetical protein
MVAPTVIVDDWVTACYLGHRFDADDVLAGLLEDGEYEHWCTFIGMRISFIIKYDITEKTLTMEVNHGYEIFGIESGDRVVEGKSEYNILSFDLYQYTEDLVLDDVWDLLTNINRFSRFWTTFDKITCKFTHESDQSNTRERRCVTGNCSVCSEETSTTMGCPTENIHFMCLPCLDRRNECPICNYETNQMYVLYIHEL